LIDVVDTERGIAINPRRQDLLDALKGSDLPIRSLEEIKSVVDAMCGGKPQKVELGDEPVAVVKWVDGTLIDTVWKTAF
jgi:citrate lyase subunit alpha/citrate CoA-transferase